MKDSHTFDTPNLPGGSHGVKTTDECSVIDGAITSPTDMGISAEGRALAAMASVPFASEFRKLRLASGVSDGLVRKLARDGVVPDQLHIVAMQVARLAAYAAAGCFESYVEFLLDVGPSTRELVRRYGVDLQQLLIEGSDVGSESEKPHSD